MVAVGAIFGGPLGGWAIDKLGRKGTIMFCVVPFELGWLLISFAQNHGMMYAGRIITGLACGMASLVVPVSYQIREPSRVLQFCVVPENIQLYSPLGRFLFCIPLPPRNSSLAILAFKTSLPLGISSDLQWAGYGFFLELAVP